MTDDSRMNSPTFFNILPIVTGEGEELFLPQFLRSLMDTGKCCFVTPRKIGQLSPRQEHRRLKMVRTGKSLTTRQEEIGLLARRFLQQSDANLVVLVDDLEDRIAQFQEVFEIYRKSLDIMLIPVGLNDKASVHFMVSMIEAYYFKDSASINAVLDLCLNDFEGDPEFIRNPKANLRQLCKARTPSISFDEKKHGYEIAKRLDLPKILSETNTCRSLRCLFKWCSRRIGDVDTERFQLADGEICKITGPQIPCV